MGFRFDGSLGAFRLVQWNARELALTALLSLKQRIGSTSGLKAGQTHPRLFRVSGPALTKAGRCAEHSQPLAPRTGPHFHKGAVVALSPSDASEHSIYLSLVVTLNEHAAVGHSPVFSGRPLVFPYLFKLGRLADGIIQRFDYA
jgi:hypothetical protein